MAIDFRVPDLICTFVTSTVLGHRSWRSNWLWRWLWRWRRITRACTNTWILLRDNTACPIHIILSLGQHPHYSITTCMAIDFRVPDLLCTFVTSTSIFRRESRFLDRCRSWPNGIIKNHIILVRFICAEFRGWIILTLAKVRTSTTCRTTELCLPWHVCRTAEIRKRSSGAKTLTR